MLPVSRNDNLFLLSLNKSHVFFFKEKSLHAALLNFAVTSLLGNVFNFSKEK